MSSPVELFAELFRGNTSTHGVHIPEPGPIEEGIKAKGQSFTKTEPVTLDLYRRHCEGDYSLGIIPIDQNNNVRFMAIDIDVYPLDPKRYCILIDRYKMPLTCFNTKSGGIHAYCFFSADTIAAKALEYLHVLRHLLSIPKETETFPKQRKLTSSGKGNWINLPYYGGEGSTRYAYDPEGNPLSFETAMEWCFNKRTTLKGLENCLASMPFNCAPPCIQSVYINNEVSINNRNRNIFLFNAATYLKSRFKDEFADKLALVNDELDEPLEITELESTIIASHTRGSYTYQCEDPLLSAHCSKELCKSREYGKGSGSVSNFSFEKMTQVKSTPPYYKWLVNGVEMVFFSESELRNQDRFMDYCIRHLHRLPNKLKGEIWTEILNSALSELDVEEVKVEDDLSSSSLWFSHLVEYLTERKIAQRPSQVSMGQVYHEDNMCYFRVEDFYMFLTEIKKFRLFSIVEIHYNLRKLGFKPTKLYDSTTRKSLRTWSCDVAVVNRENAPVDITFEATPFKDEQPAPAKPKPKDKAKDNPSGKKGAERLKELAERIDEPLDFSGLKDKEKF